MYGLKCSGFPVMLGCTQSGVHIMPATNAAAHPFILWIES